MCPVKSNVTNLLDEMPKTVTKRERYVMTCDENVLDEPVTSRSPHTCIKAIRKSLMMTDIGYVCQVRATEMAKAILVGPQHPTGATLSLGGLN